MFSSWYQFRWTLCKYVAALFFAAISFSAFTQPAFACGGSAEVKAAKTELSPTDALDATVFFHSDGACEGKVRIDLQYVSAGAATTIFGVNCPLDNQGDGVFCVISGSTYQYRYTWTATSFHPALPVGRLSLQGMVYLDGALVLTSSPLQITIVSGITSGTGSTDTQINTQSTTPKPVDATLQVAIGSLTKTSNIALYLATLFNYGLGIVGTIAITFVIWGGVKYLTAGGDSGKTTKAKEVIVNAVTGMVLAFATYLILSTINPALVNFQPITIKAVDRTTLSLSSWCRDLSADQFTLTPASGKCGEKAKVTAAKPGTKILNDSCDFSYCTDGGTCAKVGNEMKCVKCEDMTADKIGAGPGTGDSACAAFSNKKMDKGSGADLCVYSNDTGFKESLTLNQTDSGCVHMTTKAGCVGISKCSDYTSNVVLTYHGVGPFKAAYELKCLTTNKLICLSPGPSGHLGIVCSADPCGVGPCDAKVNPDANDGSLWTTQIHLRNQYVEYCCPKGVACSHEPEKVSP